MWDNAGVTPSGSEGQRLNGGGFETILGGTVTSKHNVAGDGEFATAWGGSMTTPAAANEQGTNLKGVLECTSCHNPHGSASYRILNSGTSKWVSTAAQSFGTVPMNPYDVGANGGTVDSSSRGYTWNADKMALGQIRQGFEPRINKDTPGGAYMKNLVVANYGNDISTFCGGCHTEYVGGGSNWKKDWTDGAGLANGPDGAQAKAYAHRSRQDTYTFGTTAKTGGIAMPDGSGYMNPSGVVGATTGYVSPLVFAQSTGVNNPDNNVGGYALQTCLTCHFAHGTSAVMSNWAAGVNNPNSVGFVDGSSANLFYDNRGVCITCHNP
jgi:cytochrome c553